MQFCDLKYSFILLQINRLIMPKHNLRCCALAYFSFESTCKYLINVKMYKLIWNLYDKCNKMQNKNDFVWLSLT